MPSLARTFLAATWPLATTTPHTDNDSRGSTQPKAPDIRQSAVCHSGLTRTTELWCVPDSRPMSILSRAERDRFRSTHPEWQLDGETLRRTFTFGDFVEAMGFVTKIALAAEKAFHHPDIDIRWNRVEVALTSHDVGGLTSRDAELAARIESLTG